ncbi:MAG TPA: efflux RND transporter periplasmic adaptor subunit [Thermoanaerobaculia bacterium]|nr:efflux RND transporter periplasmic adaptor subunit [Thermoanaerobaculia bacterium]
MNRKYAAAAGAAILLIIIVVASIRGNSPKGEKVYVEPAAVRPLESTVIAPGEIDPRVKVNLNANVIGKIVRLHFKEGDFVKKGQRLVDLERAAYSAVTDRARAELANRRIEVHRARAALSNAEVAYRRAISLRQQGIQAEELFDRARLELDNARAAYRSAEEGVRQAAAVVQQANTDLSYTTIHSPIDGKVVQLNAHEGEVVITGTINNAGSVIAVVADLSEILIAAEVNETEVVGIRVGQPAKVKIDAIPDKEYKGRVVEIGSSASVRQSGGSAIRYFKVKVALADADDQLRPGMTAQVSIVTNTSNVVSVPIQSVVERVPGAKKGEEEDENAARSKYVFVLAGDKVRQVEVKPGISDATHVGLLSGVKAGDRIVTGPFRVLKKLQDGDRVQIIKPDEKKTTGRKEGK